MPGALPSDPTPAADIRSSRGWRFWLGPGFAGLVIIAVLTAALNHWPFGPSLAGGAGTIAPTAIATTTTTAGTFSGPASPSPAIGSTTSIVAPATGQRSSGQGTGGEGSGGTGGTQPKVTGPTTITAVAALDDPSNDSPINLTPWHTVRPLHIMIYTTSDILVFDKETGASQTTGTDKYMAMFTLPSTWQSGAYQVKIKMDFTLWQAVRGVPTITAGVANILAVAAPVPGDVNQDNNVNVDDYNIITACYSDFQPAKGPCDATQQRGSDLNDDGQVTAPDLNLYLRIENSHPGS
jgi:hypothetical protein